MAVSGQQELFHSLWFSSSLRRTGQSSTSSPLSRKKGRHYGQGQIAQLPSFSTCSFKCTQPSSLATHPVTMKHGLTLEDNSPHQQLQSSSSGFTNSPCKYGQINQLSTYGMSGRGRVNEMIGYSSRSDRSQMHTSSAITGDGTIALKNLSPCQIFCNSRKAWFDKGDWYGLYYAYHSGKNEMPIKAERLKVVPAARKFRYAGIPPELEEKLRLMFDSVVAAGRHATTPNIRTLPRESIDERYLSDEEHDDQEICGAPPPPEVTSSKKRKKGKKKATSSVLEDLAESSKTISRCIQEHQKLSNPYTITQALERLSGYPEVVSDERLYDFAITFLLDKGHREAFMFLPEGMNIKWLRNRYTGGD